MIQRNKYIRRGVLRCNETCVISIIKTPTHNGQPIKANEFNTVRIKGNEGLEVIKFIRSKRCHQKKNCSFIFFTMVLLICLMWSIGVVGVFCVLIFVCIFIRYIHSAKHSVQCSECVSVYFMLNDVDNFHYIWLKSPSAMQCNAKVWCVFGDVIL